MLLASSWLTCKYLAMTRDSTGDTRPRQHDESDYGCYDALAEPGAVRSFRSVVIQEEAVVGRKLSRGGLAALGRRSSQWRLRVAAVPVRLAAQVPRRRRRMARWSVSWRGHASDPVRGGDRGVYGRILV